MRRYSPLFLLALAFGCGNPEPGRSSGRPPAAPVERPEPSPLRIAEVYVADADTNDHFAELVVDDDVESVDLTDAELCGPTSCIAAKDCTDSVVEPEERVLCDLGELDLPASAGELAVVVGDVVLAYLAWGADPAVFGSPWPAGAVLTGATEPGLFVPLPFPMPNRVAMINEADGSFGCAVPSPGDIGTVDSALCDEVSPTLFITEILVPADDEGQSWVELENIGSSAVRLAGARLCQLPSCIAFGYDDTIGALSRLLVHLGREGGGADSAQLFFPEAAPVRPGGEIVLLAPGAGDVAAETDSLLSFVRYGASLTGDVSAAAVAAGLWPEIFDAARAPRVAGESLSRDLSGELRGSAWNPTEPTPVAANPDIGEATDLWQSCSFPRPWREAEPSDVVVARIVRDDPALIQLRNRGDQANDLASFELALANATFTVELPVGVGGTATGVDDEAVVRIADTDVDADDFTRGAATPGTGTLSGCTGVVISEVVTRPFRDWDDSTAESVGTPFDATPGPGAADTADEWIELHNCDNSPVDLTGYTLELWDSAPNVVVLDPSNESLEIDGTLTLEGGGYVILGNPGIEGELDDILAIRFLRADGILLDEVLIFSGEVAAGGTVTVELNPFPDGRCGHPLHLCWLGAPPLPANGEVTLFDGDDALVQHFRWGTAARVYTDDAVAAGVWPLSRCALPALDDGGVIELSSVESGHSPPDYR